MTETLSHKKGIKITSNLSTNRRQALKEFYKLQESQKQRLQELAEERAEAQPVQPTEIQQATTDEPDDGPNTDTKEPSLEDFEEFVKSSEFKTLLKVENKICEELNSNQSEIKSIIYNNYYELIKINDVLLNMKKRNEGTTDGDSDDVISNLSKIKSRVVELRGMDMNVIPSGSAKNKSLQKSLGGVLVAPRIPRDSLKTIEDMLPDLNGESLILQMNELKRKALN
ncbi:unnamed protein product [Kuraishia capsulata CBS 1993]|uniref:Vacuolar protein sorting-associated protein 51 homolog n=1 Tax=Kuraishia capsulata CBS 1993 TaxID=1382522 RepID=W6MTX4_9ASCO|nr:uncharacterized protein KUCA_T00004711001 [Kuraishia capsulata CBS 1993]CDK28727.1 unnamed protein product [Kuraishia capsulata CBS 1993]